MTTSKHRNDVTSKRTAGANRIVTTMRLAPDIRAATDELAEEHGMSRTQYVEQVLAKEIRRHPNRFHIRLKSLL